LSFYLVCSVLVMGQVYREKWLSFSLNEDGIYVWWLPPCGFMPGAYMYNCLYIGWGLLALYIGDSCCFPFVACVYREYWMIYRGPRLIAIVCTANNFGLMYSRKRISQNSFPNFIHIIPKSFMVFCQELHNPKRNYENQIWT
jgi:hypothetical protein